MEVGKDFGTLSPTTSFTPKPFNISALSDAVEKVKDISTFADQAVSTYTGGTGYGMPAVQTAPSNTTPQTYGVVIKDTRGTPHNPDVPDTLIVDTKDKNTGSVIKTDTTIIK